MKQTIELEVKKGTFQNFSLNIPTNSDFHLKVTLHVKDKFFFSDLEFKEDSSYVKNFGYHLGLLTGICLGQVVEGHEEINSISDIDGLFVFELTDKKLGE